MLPGQTWAVFVRSPLRPRRDPVDRRLGGARGARRARRADRRRRGRRRPRRHPLRLADQEQGRLGHGRAAAPGPRAGQGAARRRSGRHGDRRDQGAGRATRPSSSRSTTIRCPAVAHLQATPSPTARRRCGTRRPATSASTGTSATPRPPTPQFAGAAHVVSIDLANNRIAPNAIEPRAANGHYDTAEDRYTLYTTSQNPHLTRLLLGAFTLKVPEHKLRVVAPDVGGGFGSKIFHYAEELLVLWASKRVGRPVKWTADRSEAFLSDAHGRDHVTHAELALDADGKFRGLRVRTLANMGAYLSTFAPAIPTYLYGTLLSGPYVIPAIYAEVKAIFTNTVPVDALRGAGRPEATYLLERLVDKAARELGIDRVEIRRKNLIQPDQFPYQTPVALQYDIGDYQATLDLALQAIDYARLRGAQGGVEGARQAARLRHLDLHRGVRHRAVRARRRARRARRPLRGGDGARPSRPAA